MDTAANARIVLFTSSWRGYWLLRFLLDPAIASYYRLEVVGVATDDPQLPQSNSDRRGVWKYGYDPECEPDLVPDLCARHRVPCYRGAITRLDFVEMFQHVWKPDLSLVNVFGQLLPPQMFEFPRLGTFNFHTTAGDVWPQFPGGDPLNAIRKAGHTSCRIACHRLDETLDRGELYKFTEEIPILPGSSVADMQLILASLVVCFLKAELPDLLQHEHGFQRKAIIAGRFAGECTLSK